MTAESSPLRYKTFITRRPSMSRDAPAGKDDLKWVPNTATLILGRREAVLVDTFLTIDASIALGEWVAGSGRELTTIYVTHAHADHFYGLALVKKRFPDARVVARPEVASAMKRHILPDVADGFFRKLFPGQITDDLLVAEPLLDDEFTLEGERLVTVSIGHTDTDNTTCLHVPSIDLVVTGDAAYNGVHPFLSETDAEGRRDWIAALDRIAALRPKAVIAGHKAPDNDDSPTIIAETQGYLRDFERVSSTTNTAKELYEQMLELHPRRLNPGSLWTAAKNAKGV